MGQGKDAPFRVGSGNGTAAEWERNEGNRYLSRCIAEDAADFKELGDVGTLRGGADEYSVIWFIVNRAHVTLEDIEKEWTWERLNSFSAYLRMVDDYGSAFRKMLDVRNENEHAKEMLNG